MDMLRVKQIISSPKEVKVMYHGVPIWMKHYNEVQNSVSVHTIDNPGETMVLPVTELEEA